jgi:uncharacterized protein YjbI with pentapeptide repeats
MAYLIGADLTNAALGGSTLTDADLRGANLTDASLAFSTLTNASLEISNLTGANLTGAEVTGASFGESWARGIPGLTQAQLYSTQSYQAKNLSGINLNSNHLAGWNFSGQNLTNANLGPYLPGANLTGADIRGAQGELNLPGAITTNLIRPDGHIAGLDLDADDLLVVRDDDGVPDPAPSWWMTPRDPIPIFIENNMTIAPDGRLQLRFAANDWGSTINFQPGIPVALGGTLELAFAEGVNPASQLGRTFDLFDWTGVSPTGQFSVTGPYAWDLTNLYISGEVRLAGPALPGDVDFDGQLTAADIDQIADAIRTGSNSILFDLNHDNLVNIADYRYWVRDLKQTWLGDANLDGAFQSDDLVSVLAAGEYEDDVPGNSGWATGDWNVDGDFTSSDLVVALADGGYEQGLRPAIATVPEPSPGLVFLGAAAGVILLGRHGRSESTPRQSARHP